MAKKSKATNTIDYMQVQIPEDLPQRRYNYIQRRAELLQEILQTGSSKLLVRKDLAKVYGVNKSTISRDIQNLEEYMADAFDQSSAKALINTAFIKIYHQMIQNGEIKDAWKVVKEFKDYLQELGILPKSAEQVEHIGDVIFKIEGMDPDEDDEED